MGVIGNPHRRQFAGPVEFGQHDRVTPVGLDPVAWLHRNERRRHHHAFMTKGDQLTIKAISARPSFVTEGQGTSALRQALNQFLDVIGVVEKIAEFADLTAPNALCNRDGDRRLMDIQSNENNIIHQARPPCLRLGAGQPGAILD
jgi:hypothetical protein